MTFQPMVHKFNPISGGLAVSLFLAFTPAGATSPPEDAAQYSRPDDGPPVSRDGAWMGDTIRLAQSDTPEVSDTAAAREKLRAELDKIRNEGPSGSPAASFDPPIPVRKRGSQTEPVLAEATAAQPRPAVRQADPQIDRITGQVLVLSFKGSSPSDAGPKAVKALMQSGLIAGVFFSRENIQSKAQLKELIKFLIPAGSQNRPILAVREIGGASDALPPIKDFEQWPAERDVAAKGDPQYAYSTYRSLGAAVAGLGFNLNFGPVLMGSATVKDPASSFGSTPLQTGVFAKTFVLGHREENVTAVPFVDGTEHSIRAWKPLLVANPKMPVAATAAAASDLSWLPVFDGLVQGAKFCVLRSTPLSTAPDAVQALKFGCNALVIPGADNPASTRDDLALALGKAVRQGDLTLEELTASAEKVNEVRSPGGGGWPAAVRSQ